MGCCGGGYEPNKKVKNWGTEAKEEQSRSNFSPLGIILGVGSIGLMVISILFNYL